MTTKKNLLEWIVKNDLEDSQLPNIHIIPMAAEKLLPKSPEPYIVDIFQSKAIKFLMVGTIERRKGHEFILNCFDKLWTKHPNLILFWVGIKGWSNSKLDDLLKNHPLLHKRFFYLDYISDAELSFIYQSSDALINASEDEGFGLPNIEASLFDLPIIARDIPIFREVCQDGAYYFPDTDDENIFIAYFEQWLLLHATGKIPKSGMNKIVIWDDVAKAFLSNIGVNFA